MSVIHELGITLKFSTKFLSLKHKISMYIYRKSRLTASAHILTSSRRRLGFLDGHLWRRHGHYSRSDGHTWRRHETPPKSYWPVTCILLILHSNNTWSRHMIRRDVVSHYLQLGLLGLCRFPHFFTPKTPEIASFVIFSSKVPKMRKETTLGEIRSNNIRIRTQTNP